MLYTTLPIFLLPSLLAAQQSINVNGVASNAVGGVSSVFNEIGTGNPAMATPASEAFSNVATAASFVETAGAGQFSEAATAGTNVFSGENGVIGSATSVYGSYGTNGAVVSGLNSASEIFSEAGNTASAEFSSATATATHTGSSSAKTGAAAAIEPQVLLGWSAAGVAAVVGGFWQ